MKNRITILAVGLIVGLGSAIFIANGENLKGSIQRLAPTARIVVGYKLTVDPFTQQSTFVAPGRNQQNLATFDVSTTGRERVMISSIGLQIKTTGTIDLSHVRNLRLVDAAGTLLAGPVPVSIRGGLFAVRFPKGFIVDGSSKLTVLVDIANEAAPNSTLAVAFFGARYITAVGMISRQNARLDGVYPISGNAMQIAGNDPHSIATAAGFGWLAGALERVCEMRLIDCSLPGLGQSLGQTITRAVFWQMMTSALSVQNENARSPFADVDNAWFATTAHTAYTLGWTAGVINADGGVSFDPASSLSKAMVAVSYARIAGLRNCNQNVLAPYVDRNEIPGWAMDAAACMVENNIMVGSDNRFNPNETVIKAHLIAYLDGFFRYILDNDINVIEVAARNLGTDADTLLDALDRGLNIVNGVAVPVE